MLPAPLMTQATLPRLRRAAVATAAALSIALTTALPVQALDRDERNFFKGVAAALIVGAIANEVSKNNKRRNAPAYDNYPPAHQPVYAPPAQYYGSATAQAFAEYSPASKRAIQSRLRSYGYYRGAIDGVYGAGTRYAIEAYARDTGKTRLLDTRNGTVTLLNGLLA